MYVRTYVCMLLVPGYLIRVILLKLMSIMPTYSYECIVLSSVNLFHLRINHQLHVYNYLYAT